VVLPRCPLVSEIMTFTVFVRSKKNQKAKIRDGFLIDWINNIVRRSTDVYNIHVQYLYINIHKKSFFHSLSKRHFSDQLTRRSLQYLLFIMLCEAVVYISKMADGKGIIRHESLSFLILDNIIVQVVVIKDKFEFLYNECVCFVNFHIFTNMYYFTNDQNSPISTISSIGLTLNRTSRNNRERKKRSINIS
jgi:hypothetical protein